MSDETELAPGLPTVDLTHAAEPPFAQTLDEFIATKTDAPVALIGNENETLLPAFGLAILYAKGGKGKTTLIVEGALHFASGVDWLGFSVPRPLRVLFVENEGPREPFRRKLEARLDAWPHDFCNGGEVFVHTLDWGAFSLADEMQVERLRAFIASERIDLVIADPLETVGVVGVGTPEDTREFMALMGRVGLFRDVAFLLLHHPRKQATRDELDEVSGAWAGKPDLLLRLERLDGNRSRLSFPKIRWSRRGTRAALILAFDPDSQTFTVAHEEADEHDYAAEVDQLLSDGQWRTVKEIAAPRDVEDSPGIGANAKTVKSALEGNSERFHSRTGEEAKDVGRSASSTVWQRVSRGSDSPDSPPASPRDEQGGELVSRRSKTHQPLTHPPFLLALS